MIIDIKKFDDTKILIETDGKLPDDVTVIIKWSWILSIAILRRKISSTNDY